MYSGDDYECSKYKLPRTREMLYPSYNLMNVNYTLIFNGLRKKGNRPWVKQHTDDINPNKEYDCPTND